MIPSSFSREVFVMIGLGTIVNVLAVLGGGAIGLFLRGGMNPRYQEAVVRVMGLSTIFIGASGALEHMLAVEGGSLTGLPIRDTLIMILSMAFGTLIGEMLDFDGKLESFGAWLKQKATRGEDGRFIEGFVTASLTVCIGAMAIVGSIQDGLSGDVHPFCQNRPHEHGKAHGADGYKPPPALRHRPWKRLQHLGSERGIYP